MLHQLINTTTNKRRKRIQKVTKVFFYSRGHTSRKKTWFCKTTDEKLNSESQPSVDIVFLHINKKTNSRQTWTFLIEKTFLKNKTNKKGKNLLFRSCCTT